MHRIRLFALAALVVLAPCAAQAQTMRPGLWENSLTIKSAGGEADAAMARMQAELARMTPQQRQQMQAMMGGQGMAIGGGKPTATLVCVTPQQAARQEMPAGDARCRQTGYTRAGSTVRFKFTCEGEHAGSGEGEFTLVSETEHRGKMNVESTRQGKAVRMEMQTAGRWLKADCGAVKPRS